MKRRLAAGAGAVLVLSAVVILVVLLVARAGRPATRALAAPRTSTSAPSAPAHTSAGATASASPTPSRTPSRTPPPAPPVPHDAVAPAAPTAFEMVGPAFDVKARVCGMDNIRPLDPPGDQYHTVCWVQEGFGVAPGTGSGGTSYILGHSWAEAELVLNPLATYVSPEADLAHPVDQNGIATYPVAGVNGYHVVLGTPNGKLTYVVTDGYLVAKNQAGYVQSLMNEHDPDRVVLITCAVKDGVDLDYNVIVEARLYSSARAA